MANIKDVTSISIIANITNMMNSVIMIISMIVNLNTNIGPNVDRTMHQENVEWKQYSIRVNVPMHNIILISYSSMVVINMDPTVDVSEQN